MTHYTRWYGYAVVICVCALLLTLFLYRDTTPVAENADVSNRTATATPEVTVEDVSTSTTSPTSSSTDEVVRWEYPSAEIETPAPSVEPVPVVAKPIPAAKPPSTEPEARSAASSTVYPLKSAVTTVFWVGEGESEDNGYIHNRASAWDEDWVGTYGGVDDPNDRCGYVPCDFTPEQSPFYVALPYYDYRGDGYDVRVDQVPWYTKEALEAGTLLHGRWVAVQHGGRTCYGQWRDVGPFEVYDFAYVFGTASAPKNKEGVGAGLDISPALRDCLSVGDVSVTQWRFVDEEAVPDGPWHTITNTLR